MHSGFVLTRPFPFDATRIPNIEHSGLPAAWPPGVAHPAADAPFRLGRGFAEVPGLAVHPALRGRGRPRPAISAASTGPRRAIPHAVDRTWTSAILHRPQCYTKDPRLSTPLFRLRRQRHREGLGTPRRGKASPAPPPIPHVRPRRHPGVPARNRSGDGPPRRADPPREAEPRPGAARPRAPGSRRPPPPDAA
jgi:hypothetical protein